MARPLRQSDPLEGARAELQRLRQAEDWNESTPVVHVNVQPAAKRSTPAPPPSKLQVVVQVFQRFPPWGAVLVAIVLILAWAYLAVHGKAPVP
jgi:hypothetical protein